VQVAKNRVVALDYELFDTDGSLIEKTDAPIEYLHGGYDGIFPLVEKALDGKLAGDRCRVRLDPDDAFGEYDAELVQVEPRSKFPDDLKVGTQFQGQAEGAQDARVYTVTDIAPDKVVVDANHPLAGRTLEFSCVIAAVRMASAEEMSHGHVHGPHGHHH
jgi:FKBP-type peptidyl-prolyl cis-trans isomerase SlyD